MWNTVKYANAKNVDLILKREYDQVIFVIEDDGIGFDPSSTVGSDTMGLRNMKERAKLTGGTFELQSNPGQGTRLTVQIPLRVH